MRLSIASSCHAGQEVRIVYDAAILVRRLAPAGTLELDIDLFAGGRRSVDVVFGDNVRRILPVVSADLDKVSKVAVIWRAPVNLDLHVFEYAAAAGQPGHLWDRAPGSPAAARALSSEDKRGHGFLSSSDPGRGPGDKLEVYTFLHNDGVMTGSIAMALDYESRGEVPNGAMCGSGDLAKVEYRIATLSRTGAVTRANSTLRAADCNVAIPANVRFDSAALPVMRVRN